jgi:hypothetical protein
MDMFTQERYVNFYCGHIACGERIFFYISGAGRDGGKEWRDCDLSTDRKIMPIHTPAKGVYLMKSISPTGTATAPTDLFV